MPTSAATSRKMVFARSSALAWSTATRPNRMLSWIESAELKRSGSKNSMTSPRSAYRRRNSARAATMLSLIAAPSASLEHAEAVLRDDDPERQCEQARPLVVGERGHALGVYLRDQHPELRQVVRADEAVLVEHRAVGRDVGEQLDHQARHLGTRGVEVVEQSDVAQQLDDLAVAGEVGRLEVRMSRQCRTAGSPRC